MLAPHTGCTGAAQKNKAIMGRYRESLLSEGLDLKRGAVFRLQRHEGLCVTMCLSLPVVILCWPRLMEADEFDSPQATF